MKVLVLSESIAGSGHVVAARNIAKAMEEVYPAAAIKVDNALPKVSTRLEKWTSKAYMKTISHAAPAWGWAYRYDRQWSRVWKRLLQRIVAQRLEPYLTGEQPDVVISTHAFCLGGLCELKKRMNPSFRLGASLTDFCINHFWVYDEVDDYFVGCESLKQGMIDKYGVPSSRIHVTGIPIDPVFSLTIDRAHFRVRNAIPENTHLVLVSGGGMGMAPYEEILTALHEIRIPLFVVVILGRNEQMRHVVESKAAAIRHPSLILGYVTNMSEWMAAADIMIGKPGGLTASEALSCELPFIIYKPIPGQEERNSQFLLEFKVARRADDESELRREVADVLSHPYELANMRQRGKALGRPKAALDVCRIILDGEKFPEIN